VDDFRTELDRLGVDLYLGHGRFVDERTLQVVDTSGTLKTVIADRLVDGVPSGSEPSPQIGRSPPACGRIAEPPLLAFYLPLEPLIQTQQAHVTATLALFHCALDPGRHKRLLQRKSPTRSLAREIFALPAQQLRSELKGFGQQRASILI
jgi:hypothetical protein